MPWIKTLARWFFWQCNQWFGSGLIVSGPGSKRLDEYGSGSSLDPDQQNYQIDFIPSFKSGKNL